jgi:pyrimidine operon attenuation protein/uracil phosphoribosyltransferase
MTGEDIQRALRRIAHEILETHRGAHGLVLVGIHTRGVFLAKQLGDTIASFENCEVACGELDVIRYRDDFDGLAEATPRRTVIPVPIDRSHVVVVDDVLYTGRTVRAALDALTDVGRATTTELAVLVDRGHRELPIRADYVGKNLPTATDERVHVHVREVDGDDGVWIERMEAA